MTPNNQPPEPRVKNHDGNKLDFHSIFFTIQGEGPFAGKRSIFIRLAGCNIQCPGCDTEYTQGRKQVHAGILAQMVLDICDEQEMEHTLIVITGGEPMRQNLGPLIFLLMQDGHEIQIESNGILAPSSEVALYLRQQAKVHLVVSPKTSRIHKDCGQLAHSFKYVLKQGEIELEDGLPTRALGHKALPMVARPPETFTGTIYVNPMDEQDETLNRQNLDACVGSAMMHGHTMGIQLHKLIGLE